MYKWIISLFFLSILVYVNGSLKITELRVPASIASGSNKFAILDCAYEAENETGLEVKWFYKDTKQIYQWIPGLGKPQALGTFKDWLDLEYKAADHKGNKHRASLYIKKISPSLSGNYTCKVSSFNDEETQTKPMIIYEPAKKFELVHSEVSATVMCSAIGASPEPSMKLYASYKEQWNESLPNVKVVSEVTNETDGLYNVTSTLTYDRDLLSDTVEFVCDIEIPDTDYRKRISKIYYSEPLEISLEHSEESETVICSVFETYTEPKIELFAEYTAGNETFPIISNSGSPEISDDGTYNLTRILTYPKDALKYPVDFTCNLELSDSEYRQKEVLSYNPGGASYVHYSTKWILLFSLFSTIFLKFNPL